MKRNRQKKGKIERIAYVLIFACILGPLALYAKSRSFDLPVFFNNTGAGNNTYIDSEGFYRVVASGRQQLSDVLETTRNVTVTIATLNPQYPSGLADNNYGVLFTTVGLTPTYNGTSTIALGSRTTTQFGIVNPGALGDEVYVEWQIYRPRNDSLDTDI